jgi:serine/threonine-protein kinase
MPAAVLAVLIAAATIVAVRWKAKTHGPPSVAVLPFKNLSGDKDQEYFSDGLSEEVMGVLSKVKELRVAGRTSSFAFKDKTDDLRTIGERLSVATVVEGSVRRLGDRLKVSAELVKVADGSQLWTETYDRKVADVFDVQEEIARAVVAALKVKLLPTDRPAALQSKTSVPDAYNQFLFGRQFFHRQSPDGFRRAVAAFQKAIDLDPNYSVAYAWLSRSQTMLSAFSKTPEELAETRDSAIESAEKAIALAPNLAEGYSSRGNVRTIFLRDWKGAEEDFQRALTLDPNDGMTHGFYGRYFARLGRLPEAIGETRKAIAHDPLYVGALNLLGLYLNNSGELVEAERVLSKALEISPESEFARYYLSQTFLFRGDAARALSEAGVPTTPHRLTVVALAQHSLGHQAESDQALQELISKYGETQQYFVAKVFAWRGDREMTFQWLNRALARDDPGLPFLHIDRAFSSVRPDPRFAAVLRRLEVPVGR